MRVNFAEKRKERGFLLALVVIVLAVIVIGYTVYRIIKAIKKIGPRPIPVEEVQRIQADAVKQLTDELALEHPGETVVVQSSAITFVPVYTFSWSNDSSILVQESSNLVDWQDLVVLKGGEKLRDTNRWDMRFFRMFDSLGRPINPSNHLGSMWSPGLRK